MVPRGLDRSFRLLCPEPRNFSKSGLARLGELTDLTAEDIPQEEFASRIEGFDGVALRLERRVTGEMITSAGDLRVILTPTTGLDHIDTATAREHGIQLFYLRTDDPLLASINATAEHTMVLILGLLRRLPWAFHDVKEGRWRPFAHRGRELNGKTIGVVGFGRIGAKVAERALAFGMWVIAYDINPSRIPAGFERADSLQSLLRASDVVTLHVPLNEMTYALLGDAELRQCRPGAVLINTARGEIVDQEALVRVLDEGHLSGAAVDVLVGERDVLPEDNPLIAYSRKQDHVIVTPHIGGATEEAIEATDRRIIERFEQWLLSLSS